MRREICCFPVFGVGFSSDAKFICADFTEAVLLKEKFILSMKVIIWGVAHNYCLKES